MEERSMSERYTSEQIQQAARAAHEVNRAYCEAIGDASQVPWSQAPEWQRTSAINGVAGVIAGNTPRQSHESWLEEKRATGWKWGRVKNPDAKEHPCFVAYDELPPAQRAKDALFVAVVRGVLDVEYRCSAHVHCPSCGAAQLACRRCGLDYSAHGGVNT
jgi:hypothetical protein